MELELKLTPKQHQSLRHAIDNALNQINQQRAWRSVEETEGTNETAYLLSLAEISPVVEQKPAKGKGKVEVHE